MKLPTSETAKPKHRSVPTTLAALRSVKLSSNNDPKAPAPAEEKPTSAPIGNANQGSQCALSRPGRLGFRMEGTVQVERGRRCYQRTQPAYRMPS